MAIPFFKQNISHRKLDAVAYLVALSNNTIDPLRLQKILYLADTFHIGRYGASMAGFEWFASDCGPRDADVTAAIQMYGADPIKHVPGFARRKTPSDDARGTLNVAWDALKNATGGMLVQMTQSQMGAWARHYTPGVEIPIPIEAIRSEYNLRNVANDNATN